MVVSNVPQCTKMITTTLQNGNRSLTKLMTIIFLNVQGWHQTKGKFSKKNYVGMNNIMLSRYKTLYNSGFIKNGFYSIKAVISPYSTHLMNRCD